MIAFASFIITVLVYVLARTIYRRVPKTYLSPIITCLVILSVLLLTFHVPYAVYFHGTHILSRMLDPATVGFAIPLYRHRDYIRRYLKRLLSALVVGSLVAISTSVGLARLMHLNDQLCMSMAPRSITTPIAMDVAETLGGTPVLTAIFVILTAFSGIVIGPQVIRGIKLDNPFARGVVLGIGAHGIGTSTAFEYGIVEGTVASIAMVCVALLTVAVAPFIAPIIYHLT